LRKDTYCKPKTPTKAPPEYIKNEKEKEKDLERERNFSNIGRLPAIRL
jgi:hypothetical protein